MVETSRQFFGSMFGLPPMVIGLVLVAVATVGLVIQNWNKQSFRKKGWWWVLGIGSCLFSLPIVIGFLLSLIDQLERLNRSLSKPAAVTRSATTENGFVVLPRMEAGGKGTEDDPYRIPIGRFLSIHFTGQETDYKWFKAETAHYKVGCVQSPLSYFFWPQGMKPMEVKKGQVLDSWYPSKFGLLTGEPTEFVITVFPYQEEQQVAKR